MLIFINENLIEGMRSHGILLQMVFICESGEKSSITISEVKPGLTNTDVIALMDTIIASNIFGTSKGALISKYSAQVVQREVTKWDLN